MENFALIGAKCQVCTQAFAASESVMVSPCSHNFHIECARSSLALNPGCPFCKSPCEYSQFVKQRVPGEERPAPPKKILCESCQRYRGA